MVDGAREVFRGLLEGACRGRGVPGAFGCVHPARGGAMLAGLQLVVRERSQHRFAGDAAGQERVGDLRVQFLAAARRQLRAGRRTYQRVAELVRAPGPTALREAGPVRLRQQVGDGRRRGIDHLCEEIRVERHAHDRRRRQHAVTRL